jgi:chemotaxis signal transduction protein
MDDRYLVFSLANNLTAVPLLESKEIIQALHRDVFYDELRLKPLIKIATGEFVELVDVFDELSIKNDLLDSSVVYLVVMIDDSTGKMIAFPTSNVIGIVNSDTHVAIDAPMSVGRKGWVDIILSKKDDSELVNVINWKKLISE